MELAELWHLCRLSSTDYSHIVMIAMEIKTLIGACATTKARIPARLRGFLPYRQSQPHVNGNLLQEDHVRHIP
jgi:hypothetical protein